MTTSSGPATVPRPASMWLRLAGLAAIPPAVWALARWDILPHVKLCLFQRVTGRPCPGCGMTRSVLALGRCDVADSLRMHPLGVVLAGLFAATFLGTAAGLVRGDDPVARFLARRGMALVVVLVTVFVVQWIVRGFVFPQWAPDPVGG